jgi:hypothetical protein
LDPHPANKTHILKILVYKKRNEEILDKITIPTNDLPE